MTATQIVSYVGVFAAGVVLGVRMMMERAIQREERRRGSRDRN